MRARTLLLLERTRTDAIGICCVVYPANGQSRITPSLLALLFRAAKLTAAFPVTKCSLTFARLRRLPHYRLMQISKPATLMNRKRSQEMSNFVSKPALLACPSKTVLHAAIARYTRR